MKQAILITAYRDEANLIRLLRHFSDGDAVGHFRIFVHIDTKSRELNKARVDALGIPNVEVISKYSVCWGSIRHIYAVLDLMRMMLRHEDVSYVHVISGTDLAVRSASWFVARFSEDQETRLNAGKFRMLDRGNKFDWYCRYWLPTTWNHRSRLMLVANDILQKVQRAFGITRKSLGGIDYRNLWYSHIWASYPRDACKRIVWFAENNRAFLRALNWTTVPEEVFFATAIADTAYESKKDIPYLRYSDWDSRRGPVPVVLDESDYDKIAAGEYAFARKVDSQKSAKLIRLIAAKLSDKV